MSQKRTIVLVLRSGGDFSMRDVELIVRHIQGLWQSPVRPRIICLSDQATQHYDLGSFELMPLQNSHPGTWSRIALYSPQMEKYRPFLYIDLDTAIIQSVEKIFDLVEDETQFITLEDFWQPTLLATGLVWFPAESEKVQDVWEHFVSGLGSRMDRYIRRVVSADVFWQDLTDTIYDFKPRSKELRTALDPKTTLVCFHGKPRIFDADVQWVKQYIARQYPEPIEKTVSVIIPYKVDRGWLKNAIESVPSNVQLLVSQGPGNWPENFNKVLDQATGNFIKWLHEDDMLTENCIDDSIYTIESLEADFIHGAAIEISGTTGKFIREYRPLTHLPTLKDLLRRNDIHSATLMYRREVFEKLGPMNETLNCMEEFEFNLRCLKAGLKIGYCDTTLAYYRRHPLQKVRTVTVQEKFVEREMVRDMYR